MGCLWFLKLCLKCIDLLAWPLLALGYPLCASIQAIEDDSHSDTNNLISYWILLSLIYLFEYAFLELLKWFLLWPYFKLTIIFWLVIPDFRRSFLVYRQFVHLRIFMNPRRVISRIENWKKSFFKKENFLLQAEDYIKDNGTEALEKLISSKNMARSIEEEAVKAVPSTEKIQNKQMKETSGKSLHIEQSYIKVAEKKEVLADKNPSGMAGKDHIEQRCITVVEKKEVHADKNANPAAPTLSLNESKSLGAVDANRKAGKDVDGELPHSVASKKTQKEWTCAICQITATSEKTLNIHLDGRKHKAACEALKGKVKIQQVKKEQKKSEISVATQPGSEPEKIIRTDAVTENSVRAAANKTKQLNAKNVNWEFDNGLKGFINIDQKKMQKQQNIMGKPVGINDAGFRCNLCNVICYNEGDMASHLNGRKHLAQVKSSSGP